MPLSLAAQNFSHGWFRTATHVALFESIDVDGTMHEVSGDYLDIDGFPIYTRRPIALTDAADGSASSNYPVRFNIPAGTTIRWWGLVDYNGELLCIEPISTAVLSDIPMPCLFRDGWVMIPSAQTTFRAPYAVFWGGPSPSSSLINGGAYSSLPPEVYERPYWLWRWVVPEVPVGQQFQIQADELSDVLVPSNGWGWLQRVYPITYVENGTFVLPQVNVRTTG